MMDEPTARLDFANQAPVLRAVRAIAARSYGIVLSTHDPDHAFACATTVALLHEGHLTAEGPPAEVLTAARLESVYGVRVFIEHLASGHAVCAPDLGAALARALRRDKYRPAQRIAPSCVLWPQAF